MLNYRIRHPNDYSRCYPVATLSGMKRLFVMVLCFILLFCLSGCSSKAVEVSASDDSVVQADVDPNDESIVAGETDCDNPGEISPGGKYICTGGSAFYWSFRSEESSTPEPEIVSTPAAEASSNNGVSEAQKAAQDLVRKNTALQDSCYFTRTTNGDNPTYARELCIARFPNSLEWALSTNHASEESCYDTRVFNGDNEINARITCLSRYPIRN
jgi:hypothetical protein